MRTTDTIAAISSSLSPAGIGIVRISGKEAVQIADKIYKGSHQLKDQPSHTIHYGYIYDGDEAVDQVLIMLMRAPRTYTGEDTVEIDCHGGLVILQRILTLTFKAGAVPAEPGEFTRRAFLNGKIDLSRAEAVIDVIEAENEEALKAGMMRLKGSLYKEITELRDMLKIEIAYIEAVLDDPEHYDFEGYDEKLLQTAGAVSARIRKLLDHADNGIYLKSGIDTVILGKPNTGKSSLYNLLSGSDRAIVTNIPGTTRDTLEDHINLKGIRINLTDTAGLRDSTDTVESIGIMRARTAAEKAELILCVLDRSTPFDSMDREILNLIKDQKVIILLNKSDKAAVQITREEIKKELKSIGSGKEYPVIEFSASTGQGLDKLEETIRDMFYNGQINVNDQIYISTVRQKQALSEAAAAIENVKESIASGMPEDFYSIDLMHAYEALGQITGETAGDEIIDEIFSRFCMGK